MRPVRMGQYDLRCSRVALSDVHERCLFRGRPVRPGKKHQNDADDDPSPHAANIQRTEAMRTEEHCRPAEQRRTVRACVHSAIDC
jgi:hypothetical protein